MCVYVDIYYKNMKTHLHTHPVQLLKHSSGQADFSYGLKTPKQKNRMKKSAEISEIE